MKKKDILCGIAFNYHDSSVSFASEDEILLVLEAERVFRKKKKRCDSKEMEKLILYGLNLLGKNVDNVSYWALGTLRNPWLEEKDKQPNPPVWRDVNILGKKRRSLVVNHHLSHASAFLFFPLEEAIILTCDGGGDCGERVTVYTGKRTLLTKEDINVRDFITAKFYDLCATYLYSSPMCEGKLMALEAYGEPTEKYVSRLEDLLPILCATDYESGDAILSKAFPGLKSKASISNKEACNFSASVQEVFVRHRIKNIKRVVEEYKISNLVLSGGSCLNLEVNTEFSKNSDSIKTYVPPCCDDTGQSLGALSYLITTIFGTRPKIRLPYLGYGKITFEYSDDTIDKTVDRLLDNQVILLHNGKAEIGPRALGNRSFIGRPDSLGLKEILNQEIKRRESYRPLAPVVIEDKVHEYYIGPDRSPFMLDRYFVKDSARDLVTGGVHYDNTARVQTLNRDDNKFLYDLVERFGERTGIYALLNTSLNLRGEPISNTIENTLEISNKLKHKHTIIHDGEMIE